MTEPFHLIVDGIVAQRNKEPYVRLLQGDKPIAQLTLAQARKIAMDMLVMASRTEADAMLIRFFEGTLQAPIEAAHAMLQEFRLFRFALDEDTVEGVYIDPDTGEQV